jgi:hypothetical protein
MRIAILLVGFGIGLTGCLPNTELVVTKSGTGSGSVKSDPFGIDCGDQCTMHMDAEGVVKLTATPEMGHAFRGWSGECSGTGTCTIDSSFSAEVDARFEVVSTINVQMTGAGVDVVSDPPGLVCNDDGTCSGEFVRGTDVTLSFAQQPSLHFDGWSGACQGIDSACTVHVGEEPIDAALKFRRLFALTLSATGEGYLVGAGTTCHYGGSVALVPDGDAVTLLAQRSPMAMTSTWSGDCASTNGDSCTLVMNQPHTTSVWFH